jgi:hypothetical protein
MLDVDIAFDGEQIHSDMISGNYFGNGDDTPLSPLFPFSYGLSYTTFNFSALAVDVSDVPPSISGGVNGDKLANFSVAISVLVTNTGSVAGSTPVMAVYSKLTHGVVRNLRDLAGFVKVHVSIIRPIFSLDTTSRVRSVSAVCVGRL